MYYLNRLADIAQRDQVPKTYREGTNRSVSPETTIERVRPFFGAMGITRVANITGLDDIGIPVVMVCQPNARSVSVSQGKGLELSAAKASGVMEGVEAYHAECIELPVLLFEAYSDIKRKKRIADVRGLPRASRKRFHAKLPLLWTVGYDLLEHEPVWVPHELVELDFTLPRPSGSGCFLHSSTGLASGNDMIEALIHAICEVVERDSISLWDLLGKERKEKTGIDLETVDDPGCQKMLFMYRDAGIAVGVWETTSDVEVPSFACYIVPEFDDPFRRLYANAGYGCHPSRRIALLRALSEAAQSRLTAIAGSRDDVPRSEYKLHRDPRTIDKFRSEVRRGAFARRFQDVSTFEGETLNEDLEWLLGRLRLAGIKQVIAIDLTRRDFQIPVVRVVIPYLEGASDSRRYVPGPRAQEALARTR